MNAAAPERDRRRSRAFRRARRFVVGRGRADGAAASPDAGPRRLGARRRRPAFRPRGGGRPAARGPEDPRRRLRRRPVRRAAREARRATCSGSTPRPPRSASRARHAEETGASSPIASRRSRSSPARRARFDVVTAMEVVEHVADPARFVADAASLLKPGGLFLASTLNRTLKSFALAIVGAEYVLRWLEPGTHRWEQFVTPEELTLAARQAGLKVIERKGVSYDPLRRTLAAVGRSRRQLPVRGEEAGLNRPCEERRRCEAVRDPERALRSWRASRRCNGRPHPSRAFLREAVHRLGEARQRIAVGRSRRP